MADVQLQIPQAAFKDARCTCGSIAFVEAIQMKVYPGGIYSKEPIAMRLPLFFCFHCKQPFDITKPNVFLDPLADLSNLNLPPKTGA